MENIWATLRSPYKQWQAVFFTIHPQHTHPHHTAHRCHQQKVFEESMAKFEEITAAEATSEAEAKKAN